MSNTYVLAIDHGTSGIKAALVSTRGQVVDFAFEETPIHFLEGGGAEQDPCDWWDALLRACGTLVRRGAVPAERIRAVCVSSTFSSTVAVDRKGDHLMPALTWMDSRGAPYVKRLMRGFPSIQGYGLRQLLRWLPPTGGGPTLSGKDDIAHVLLIREEFPEVYARTATFLPSKDYLNLRLTGQCRASYDSMQLFWVTDIRDVDHIHYDDELIRQAGIARDKLPDLASSTAVLAPLSAPVADAIGLARDVPVFMGSPDHQCALIGSGAVRDYEGHVYIGTSSWVQCPIPFKKTDPFHSIAAFPTAIPGRYQSVNEQDIAGGLITFLVHNLLFPGNPLRPESPPPDVYTLLDRIAEGVPAGSHKLIVTPWLNGERTPVDDTTLRAGIHNLSTTTTQDHLIRAFLEGVAYNIRWSLGYVERFVGRRFASLNLVGGGALSDVWCQILSDVLDREILQVKDPMQANARGAAFIAAVGLGEITFADIPSLMEYAHTFRPRPENRRIYDELFKGFVRIYRKNRGLYRRLNAH